MSEIFICYSHADEALVKRFLIHLKPIGHSGTTAWSDHRIAPSSEWDREIREKLASCGAAVLMVSADFLASDYINRVELPALLQARNERGLKLFPLYLRICRYQDLPAKLQIAHLHGLNDPAQPIAELATPLQDRAFADAVGKLVDVLRADAPKPPSRRGCPELTLRVERTAAEWTGKYFVAGQAYASYQHAALSRPLPESGEALWKVLFPNAASAGRALAAAFGTGAGVAPTPKTGPLRIRVVTAIPELRNMLLARATYESAFIVDHGWTVEFAAAVDPRTVARVRLPGPCLILCDETADNGLGHAAATELVGIWDRVFPKAADHPVIGATWEQARAMAKAAPGIVAYCGRLRTESNPPQIALRGATGEAEWQPLAQLASLGAEILFLHLESATPELDVAAPSVLANVPVVIAQHSGPDHRRLGRQARTAVWKSLLSGEPTADPVLAAELNPLLMRTQVWTSAATLQVDRVAPAPKRVVHMKLDRALQKSVVFRELSEAFRGAAPWRICACIATGGPGNRADLFGRQLFGDLQAQAQPDWIIRHLEIELPLQADFSCADVERCLRQLPSSDHATLARRLVEHGEAEALGADTRMALLLSFKARGGPHGPLPTDGALAEWLRFVAAQRAEEIPHNVRLMTLLSLESDAADLPQRIQSLGDDPRLQADHFHFLPLSPLHHVPASDLRRFLKDPDQGCPEDLRESLPGLLLGKTGGAFEETAAWLQRAHDESWHAIADELRATAAARSAQQGASP